MSMDLLSCEWDAAQFLIFSGNVFAPLIYYSHLAPLIISVLIGLAVLINNSRALVNRTLFVIMAAFAVWVYFDLILLASEKPEYIMFFWSALAPIELLIYAAAWYLITLFARGGNEPSNREKVIAVLTFLPVFLLAHTSYNLLGYDYTNCDRAAIEGPLWQYIYFVELFYILWIARLTFAAYRTIQGKSERTQLLSVGIGIIVFLTMFTAGNITLILSLDWSYEQYKLFGMPILAAFIAYSTIRFKTFNLKIITAQALVIAVSILVFSLLFVRTIQNVRVITVLTFILVCVLGYILIRNVRKEIQLRELIQRQEQELEVVNKQQENLLHFISHEIKGYLTKSEAGFAAITEGDYGAISEQLKTMSQAALADVRKGVRTVMEILDSSNMKKGTVGYKMQTFDFRNAVKEIVAHLKRDADKKGLTMDIHISREGEYRVSGDEVKLRQHVIRNLVDNAIKYTPSVNGGDAPADMSRRRGRGEESDLKTLSAVSAITDEVEKRPSPPSTTGYTPKGHIEVHLSDGPSTKLGVNKIRFSVKDNGVGITPLDMKNLFTEGGHGKDSIKINVHSTGYGLFIAKQVVDTHGGKIWAESEGEGKGARFVVELPAL